MYVKIWNRPPLVSDHRLARFCLEVSGTLPLCFLGGLEKLPPHTPTLVLLDIPNNGAFYKYVPRSQGESITARTITSFIAECKIGTCPKSQMALGIY